MCNQLEKYERHKDDEKTIEILEDDRQYLTDIITSSKQELKDIEGQMQLFKHENKIVNMGLNLYWDTVRIQMDKAKAELEDIE